MLSLIRNHSIKPMGRKAFTKRIVVIELIGFLGTFYYYANIEQVRRFIISLIKNGTGNVISSIFIWLIIGLRLLELLYIAQSQGCWNIVAGHSCLCCASGSF